MIKIIKVGLCAYGMSGKLFQAPFFHVHPGFSLDYIVKRSDTSPIEDYPNTSILSSVEALINQPELDLVVVNTPIQTHYHYAKEALLKGKHVLVEKPFTVSSKEAGELIDIATEKNLTLSIFQNRRWDRDYQQVKKIIQSNVLGDIHEVQIRFDRFRTHASGKFHKEGHIPGSGALYDIGSHIIDQAIQLFGLPKHIYGDLMQLRDDVHSDDYFEVILYYEQLRVRLISNIMTLFIGPGYIVHGSKGSLIQERSDSQEQLLSQGIKPSKDIWQTNLSGPDADKTTIQDGIKFNHRIFSQEGNYYNYFDALYQHLMGMSSNPVLPQDAYNTIKIIELAHKSNILGCKVSFE
ncbi:MAG: Gfo/Idh/MocA family oxidoreductase [Saprospiraceae bacterium]|nr:Gfo/Idh/MocA family oxidoreductase [Saprospiraceae bacterium]